MIPAGTTELRNAFHRHANVADEGNENSHLLLFFYCIECGLKSIYLKRNRLLRTDKIENVNLRRTHDLYLLIKDLRLPAQIAGSASPSFRLDRDGRAYQIKSAHEIWRYGITIKAEDITELIEWMGKVRDWIREEI